MFANFDTSAGRRSARLLSISKESVRVELADGRVIVRHKRKHNIDITDKPEHKLLKERITKREKRKRFQPKLRIWRLKGQNKLNRQRRRHEERLVQYKKVKATYAKLRFIDKFLQESETLVEAHHVLYVQEFKGRRARR